MDKREEKKERVIGIIGGDLRTIWAARSLSQAGFSCRLFALGEKQNPCAGGFEKGRCRAPYLLEETVADAQALLLPLPLTKDGKSLNAPLSAVNLPLSSLLTAVSGDLPIFGGNLDHPLFLGRRAPTFDLLKEEGFAEKNALLTALGALGLALLEHPGILEESRVAILGFGRIGRALSSRLLRLGVELTVFARSEEKRAQAGCLGCRALGFEELASFLPFADLIFNTAPAEVISEGMAGLFKKDALYLELASAPYGMSEQTRGALCCRHLYALGLPGRYAPKYAGELIARRVLEELDASV